ncbi:MAG: bifunctional [glutamate--ammonia ligase]-adenylyl-L-tyrosine phosphorylase/[glutamate--ammonia-ligase] adenylyltransferase, partial [Pseudomonas sp.]
MSLPSLAELPAILLPLVTRAEQSFRTAVAALDDDHGLSTWTPERWAQFARVTAASDFVIEQSVRDPLMLLELVGSGELDRSFAAGELCAQIAAAVTVAETDDQLGRALRRQRARHQV